MHASAQYRAPRAAVASAGHLVSMSPRRIAAQRPRTTAGSPLPEIRAFGELTVTPGHASIASVPASAPRDSTLAVGGNGFGSLIVYSTAIYLGFKPEEIMVYGPSDNPVGTYQQCAYNDIVLGAGIASINEWANAGRVHPYLHPGPDPRGRAAADRRRVVLLAEPGTCHLD
jgi:hypothetical protein